MTEAELERKNIILGWGLFLGFVVIAAATFTVNNASADSFGGTLTGALSLAGNPTNPNDAANKAYVDAQVSTALPKSGGTVTGTVTGLLQVFSQIAPDTGLPDPVNFTKGVALALSATVIGLSIAIPSLVGSGYLSRRIENYAAQLDVLLERILQRGRS